ncbi:phytanoyl-CoA dioxygenase family protein [Pelagibacterales bacterium SAG-MED41]|nr:phytanoyl-CoA dioxygenase family protein [Pelagibacterales bacterium SAG-MED41]MBD1146346.1 phytanoyl-CoA dioxygenase family protein [Pelagibacterales bacterium SAG-MED28]
MAQNIRKEFEKNGFVRIRNVLDYKLDLEPILNDMAFIMNRLVHRFVPKKDKKRVLGLSFKKKYSHLVKLNIPELDQYFNIRLPQNVNVDSDFFASQSIFNLIKNNKILEKVSKILGQEISSNPCQNSRIKQPEKAISKKNLHDGLVGRTPWHQDAGVMNKKGQKGTELVTCWIPFTKTRIENGCMMAVKESHKLGLVNHDTGSKGQVEIKGKEKIDDLKTIALEANVGDIILLSRYLIHCSLPNKSKNFRISMDLRFNKTGQHSGRDPLPSFVVKSKNRKKIKVNNYKQWIAMWEEAKNKCIPRKWTYKYPLPTFKNSKRDLPNVI